MEITEKNTFSKARTAAVFGGLLAVPFTFLIFILIFQIELNFGPLNPIIKTVDGEVGAFILLSTLLLAVIGLWINLRPFRKGKMVGKSFTEYRLNLVVAVLIVIPFLLLIGAIIVDQYPCWAGVPNCD